jgi:NDMA-dependent alcohol dehydrogenase
MIRAAVLTAIGQPLEIRDDVELEAPHAGEVRVRMAASGVCHSDLSTQNGTMLSPVPVVLGHEGAGVVEEVGEGVTSVAPGDHVVISWVPQCGTCYYCQRGQGFLCERAGVSLAAACLLDGSTRFRSAGVPLHQMASSGTFAEVSVVPETGVVKIPDDIDLKAAALIGCGVLTGAGAAMNTARIAAGDTVAVLGCGGVGLNVVQGARIMGAGEIVAIDTNDAKLDMARTFGATTTINASTTDPLGAVMDITQQRGADVTFEVIGLEKTIEQAVRMARRGGQAVLVGVPRMDVAIHVPAFVGMILSAKTVTGCWYGSSNVQQDVPRLIELYRSGQLKLDELISRTIRLDEVNEAFETMQTGEIARSVIDYGPSAGA